MEESVKEAIEKSMSQAVHGRRDHALVEQSRKRIIWKPYLATSASRTPAIVGKTELTVQRTLDYPFGKLCEVYLHLPLSVSVCQHLSICFVKVSWKLNYDIFYLKFNFEFHEHLKQYIYIYIYLSNSLYLFQSFLFLDNGHYFYGELPNPLPDTICKNNDTNGNGIAQDSQQGTLLQLKKFFLNCW